MPETLPIRKTVSILSDIERMQDRVMRRAFEIFEETGGIPGRDVDNWVAAERELVWKPAVELKEKNEQFTLTIAVAGVGAKDLLIQVTPEDLLVKAESRHEHDDDKGLIHTCEFQDRTLFRTVHFPKRIDANKVTAELKNGMLTITAAIASDAEATRSKVHMA